jgi:Fic family protein
MPRFIWDAPDWPRFRWDAEALLPELGRARHAQGLLLGRMRRLGFDLALAVEADAVTEEVIKTSEIEGETLDRASVRSSVARRLGLPEAATAPEDRRVEGVVSMALDATRFHRLPLTADRLCSWQAALFPTGHSGLVRIRVGAWRDDADGPMQVVSGPIGRQRVHYEAPPASRVPAEIAAFLDWFERPGGMDGLMHAALAHLWFVTIHPFEDGNGRVARAVSDMALARMEGGEHRFYGVSSQIRRERNAYYDVLERTQKGDLDVTGWISWFLGCHARAVEAAETACAEVLVRAEFWQRHAAEPLSERQRRVLNRLFDAFEGKLTAKKWASLAKVSVDTAQRDINDLLARGILHRNPGGSKNTSYSLRPDAAPPGRLADPP